MEEYLKLLLKDSIKDIDKEIRYDINHMHEEETLDELMSNF